jgi:hypothetical protein
LRRGLDDHLGDPALVRRQIGIGVGVDNLRRLPVTSAVESGAVATCIPVKQPTDVDNFSTRAWACPSRGARKERRQCVVAGDTATVGVHPAQVEHGADVAARCPQYSAAALR